MTNSSCGSSIVSQLTCCARQCVHIFGQFGAYNPAQSIRNKALYKSHVRIVHTSSPGRSLQCTLQAFVHIVLMHEQYCMSESRSVQRDRANPPTRKERANCLRALAPSQWATERDGGHEA